MSTIAEQYNEVTLSLQSSRNTIRNKLIELGLAASADTLDKLAIAIESIVNQGAVSIQVKEGETAAIPAGFHNGAGTVAGVGGGGNYTLQSPQPVTPTKTPRTVTPDQGYYGLSSVTVNAIPDAYQDVSGVTAGAEDVLIGKIIVSSSGVTVPGSMPDNGKVTQILDVTTLTYTIPKGKHDGTGTVKIVAETKTATPKKTAQKIEPSSGKVLTQVTVGAIPDQYQDVTNVDAEAEHVLIGKTIVDASGKEIEGNMPDNGAKTSTLNAGGSYTIPKGYHNGSGKITAKSLASQTEADAVDGDILAEKTAWVDGVEVTGTMPNNGAQNLTINPLAQSSVQIPAGYTSGGTVTVTEDLLNALKAI